MTTKKKRPKSDVERTTVRWEKKHGSQEVTSTHTRRGGRAKLKRPRG